MMLTTRTAYLAFAIALLLMPQLVDSYAYGHILSRALNQRDSHARACSSFLVLASSSSSSSSTSSSGSSSKSAGNEIVEARLVVKGASVHGPYYRTVVKNEAVMMRKLKGSFYELNDGQSTEIIVQGVNDRVASFIRWVEKGPPLALRDPVTVVSVEYRSSLGNYSAFEMKHIREP